MFQIKVRNFSAALRDQVVGMIRILNFGTVCVRNASLFSRKVQKGSIFELG